jgi:hypothetical protein
MHYNMNIKQNKLLQVLVMTYISLRGHIQEDRNLRAFTSVLTSVCLSVCLSEWKNYSTATELEVGEF